MVRGFNNKAIKLYSLSSNLVDFMCLEKIRFRNSLHQCFVRGCRENTKLSFRATKERGIPKMTIGDVTNLIKFLLFLKGKNLGYINKGL